MNDPLPLSNPLRPLPYTRPLSIKVKVLADEVVDLLRNVIKLNVKMQNVIGEEGRKEGAGGQSRSRIG
jgi:hypothetical protein